MRRAIYPDSTDSDESQFRDVGHYQLYTDRL